MIPPRISLSASQTQALVSLLSTIGPAVSIDIREYRGAILVTGYRQEFSEPVVWRIDPGGGTYETTLDESVGVS